MALFRLNAGVMSCIKPRPSTNIWMTAETLEEVEQSKYIGSTQTKDRTSIKEVKIKDQTGASTLAMTRLVIL